MTDKPNFEKWNLVGRSIELSDDELFDRLAGAERKIVVLDGYSGCGKSRMIRRLKALGDREVFVFSEEKMAEIMVQEIIQKRRNDQQLLALSEKEAIVCIEDIDFAYRKSATLEEIRMRSKQAARRHLVIITGNDMCEKMEQFLRELGGEVWKKYRP